MSQGSVMCTTALIAYLAACGAPGIAARESALTTCPDFVSALSSTGGDLEVPPGGCTIDQTITISHQSTVKGTPGSPLTFTGDGKLIIAAPSIWRDIEIKWPRSLDAPGTTRLISIIASDVIFEACHITTDISRAAPFDNPLTPPATWLFDIGSYGHRDLSGLVLRRCTLRNVHPYTTGALVSYNLPPAAYQMTIEDNLIEGFHGALYVLLGSDTLIQRNTLWRNSFGNLALSGPGFMVQKNAIMHPGTSTSGVSSSGDGITARAFDGGVIVGNEIVGGGCYGIALYDGAGVAITGNTVADGVTTGILAAGSPGPISDLTIANNTLLTNGGWGIAAIGVQGLVIENNVFFGDPEKEVGVW